jgi:hypothetical protein
MAKIGAVTSGCSAADIKAGLKREEISKSKNT